MEMKNEWSNVTNHLMIVISFFFPAVVVVALVAIQSH